MADHRSWSRPIEELIEKLVRDHGGRVMALAEGVLGPGEDARDAYQDTWFAVWRSLGTLRRRAEPWPFIREVALSRSLDRLRSRRARGMLEASR